MLLLTTQAVTGSRFANAAPSRGHTTAARIFRSILPALRRTGVPPLLPTDAGLNRYHASIVIAKSGRYDVFLGYVPNCQGDACEYGELIGKKRTRAMHRPVGRPIALSGAHTGYFLAFRCGASCGESTVTVDVQGFRYVFGIKAGTRHEVVKLANSAVRAGSA